MGAAPSGGVPPGRSRGWAGYRYAYFNGRMPDPVPPPRPIAAPGAAAPRPDSPAAPLPEAELTGEGLRLRPWQPEAEEDVDAWLRGVLDEEFLRWNTPLKPITDRIGARESLRRRAEEGRAGSAVSFCVTDAADGTVLGHLAFQPVDPVSRSARVGYWVLPEARGHRVAARALRLAGDWAFTRLGLHRVELGHAMGHLASCRIAEQCGYPAEGVLRGAMFAAGRHDAFRDVHLHARLASDHAAERDGVNGVNGVNGGDSAGS